MTCCDFHCSVSATQTPPTPTRDMEVDGSIDRVAAIGMDEAMTQKLRDSWPDRDIIECLPENQVCRAFGLQTVIGAAS